VEGPTIDDETMRADGVIGREQELAAVASLLDRTREGSAGLVLTGEAGVGKTTIWRAGIEGARERSFRVLSASPVAAETTMSFAATCDLLAGVVDEVLPRLPAPQRRALEVALLLVEPEGPAPDQRAVAVAFFNLLGALGASDPVLVAVDDVQWLDAASAGVLGYAARRLREQRVGLLLTERSVGAAGLPLELDRALVRERLASVRVGPLTLGAIGVLLRRQLGFAPSRPILLRIHETAGGNPFYALELARALEREGLRPAPGEPLPLPESLGELVRGRIATLASETQDALLVAAALSDPRLGVVTAALGADPRSALRPAVDAELITLEGERIRFAHPLLAAAAYQSTAEPERREVHRRLAQTVGELEERARHLALAAERPDAEVAQVLERAAEHASGRGASAAAAGLCGEARRLTPPDRTDDAERRTLATARYRFLAGDTGSARVLLEEALLSAGPGQARAELLVLLGRLHRYEGDQPRAAELLRRALAEPAADERVRAEAAQGLAATLYFMREELEVARRHGALAAELAARAGARSVRAISLADKANVEALLGRAEAATTLRTALRLGEVLERQRVVDSPSYSRTVFLSWTDGHEEAAVGLRRLYEDALARGDESSVSMILATLAVAEWLAGNWQEAVKVADEGYELALQTGQRPQQGWSLSARALVRASFGLEGEARADAERAVALAGERGMAVARINGLWALGLLELALDRPAETARLLTPERERLLAAGVAEPGSIRFVPDEIEALIALGRLDEAEAPLGWLEQRGRAVGRVSALGAAWRCRGLLLAARGDGSGATSALERALVEHERVPIPFERARSLLALGSAQRRAKRKRAARESLGEALATFERLGAAIWALRTSRELERISGRAPSRDELTPTERRVVELVAGGRTNQEVAAVLFVSPRTVEFHLRNVFRKLDVHSRAELVRRFASPVS
jgi:DNA-binding CsgD family transcriptional regulator